MKISKYITAAILLAVATVLLIVFNIDGFPHALPNTYKLTLMQADKVELTALNTVARAHDVLFCAVTTTETGLQKEDVTFYAAPDYTDTLWDKHLGLKPGVLKDMLGNERTLRSDTLDALAQDEAAKRSVEVCYLFGEPDDCKAVVNALQSEYGSAIHGTMPKAGIDELFPGGVFAFVFLLLMFYCYLDASFEKKEIAIRVLHGDSALYHYVRFCLTDTVVFSLIFAACCLLQDAFTQTLRFYTNTRWIFIPFLLCIWVVNLHLLQIRPKEMLYGHQLSEKLLNMLTAMGNAAALLSCIVILSMLSMLPSIQKYQKAGDFFISRQDYAFLSETMSFEQESLSEEELAKPSNAEERRFLREQDDALAPVCISDVSGELNSIERDDLSLQLIYCNHRALPYVQSVYAQAAQADLEQYDAFLLLPASYTAEEAEIASLLLLTSFESAEGYLPEEARIQRATYESEAELLCFRELANSRFAFCTNPAVLIASDTLRRADAEALNIRHDYLQNGSIYSVTSAQALQELSADYALHVSSTNVYEKFQMEYQVQKSLITMIVVVTFLILLLYVSVLRTILQLDYQVNATELAIKKTLGYTVFQKNRQHFITALVIGGINLIAAIVYVQKTGMQQSLPVLVVPLALMLLNIGLIYLLIRKIEAEKLSKILKGGAL